MQYLSKHGSAQIFEFPKDLFKLDTLTSLYDHASNQLHDILSVLPTECDINVIF